MSSSANAKIKLMSDGGAEAADTARSVRVALAARGDRDPLWHEVARLQREEVGGGRCLYFLKKK